jgi:hypothetical protein
MNAVPTPPGSGKGANRGQTLNPYAGGLETINMREGTHQVGYIENPTTDTVPVTPGPSLTE